MVRLQIISLFLALVMSIQMLPVAQIGYALGSNQWTEELPHNVEKGSKEDGCAFESLFLPVAQPKYLSHYIDVRSDSYIHISEQIPSNHSTDVVSPPPDVVAL
jgi:hypothetical protein